jgi:hypothetical protein
MKASREIIKMEAMMRIALVAAALAALMLVDLSPARAYYGNGPWCAVQTLGADSSTEDCRMMSFEQCRLETVAGNRGYCIPNPYRTGAYGLADPARRPHKRRVRQR